MTRSVKLASHAIAKGDRMIRLRQAPKFTPGPWALQDLPKLLEGNWHNCVLATNSPELLGMAKKTRTICRELMDGSAITNEQKAILHRHWVELSIIIDNAEGRHADEQVDI
jgi:hypothetical protein